MPVFYNHSCNTWMTRTIFQQWFQKSFVPEVRRPLWKQGLHTSAVLFLDICPAHPQQMSWPAMMSRSRLCSSPKNMTSKIQLLVQGIIQNIKMNYYKELMEDTGRILHHPWGPKEDNIWSPERGLGPSEAIFHWQLLDPCPQRSLQPRSPVRWRGEWWRFPWVQRHKSERSRTPPLQSPGNADEVCHCHGLLGTGWYGGAHRRASQPWRHHSRGTTPDKKDDQPGLFSKLHYRNM